MPNPVYCCPATHQQHPITSPALSDKAAPSAWPIAVFLCGILGAPVLGFYVIPHLLYPQ